MQIFNRAELIDFVKERRELFDDYANRNPFACSAWILHFVEQVAEPDWNFIVAESHIDGQSLMLLYSENADSHHRKALANYYTSLYSPLITTSLNHGGALAGLIGQMASRSRPECATITLAPLEQNLADLSIMRSTFSEHGWYVKQFSCFGNWYLPCANLSFESYMAQRPSQLHNTWARKSKRFEGQHAHLEIITDPARVQSGMEAYQKVFAKSWKKPEPYPGFIPGWAGVCAENGWLRLGIAWVGEVPIAAQFWFTMHGRASIFKLAYDDAYSKWSAGTVLTAHMIKYSLERDRVIEIDYLTGDDTYKQSWMTHRRERVGIRACNLQNVRGILSAASERAGELHGRWRRRLSGNGRVES
jgi:hypothetical protein